jgi:integrase
LCDVLVEGLAGTRIRLAEKAIATVTKADVDAVGDARRAALADGRAAVTRLAEDATKPEGERMTATERARLAALASVAQRSPKGGEVGINRLIARLRHLFNWAIGEGYVVASPFVRNGVSVVRLTSGVESVRTRRLVGDEEARLLAHANPHLRALIIAALSTGCRLGELLSLQWSQVQVNAKGEPAALVLVAEKTKTSETRVVPVGGRLRAVLDMRRLDAAGKPHRPDAYVFGHVETGERVTTIKTAWGGTCRRGGIVDLHFHDLRREFCCRLMETGASLHDVKEFAGHANVTTTSRYLKSSPLRLAKVLDAMETSLGAPKPQPPAPEPQPSTVVN